MTVLTRRQLARASPEVAPLDLTREVELARRMTDEATARYETAVELWEGLTGEQQVLAQSEGMRPPTSDEVLRCLDVCGRLQTRLLAVDSRDAVSFEALLGFMTQVRALIAQFVPDEATQKALISAIQSLDIRS